MTLTLLLLTFGCCCACPAYYLTPIWRQYPASATITSEVAGLTLRDEPEVTRRLEARARGQNWFAEDTFAARYDGGPGWLVTVYGSTGFRLTPESDLDAEIARLTEDFAMSEGAQEVEAGDAGGHQRCGVGAADGDDLVVCAWADHGSFGVATFSAGSIERSAETLRELRTTIITRE
jgi:hypothetical protein